MSDVQQPVVAPVETEPKLDDKSLALPADAKILDSSAPADSAAPTVADVEPAAAPTETALTEAVAEVKPTEAAAPVVAEAAPITQTAASTTSGYLGYKGPGLLKSLIFSKRYFFLGDEPVSHEHLGTYLGSEKAEHGHHNAAWSSKTGKGLLFVAKSEAENKTPQEIINLSDASAVEKASPHEFSFKVHAHKHSFKASSDAERDAWVSSIEAAITEAKANKSTIVEDETYKKTLSHLAKPAAAGGVVAAATAAVSAAVTDQKDEEAPATEAVETPAPTTATESHAPAAEKRSSSRGKRASIFGAFKNKVEDLESGRKLKKEEKSEVKEEEKEAEHVPAVAALAEASEPTPAAIGGADAPLDARAVAERATGSGAIKDGELISSTRPAKETPAVEPAATTAAASKPNKRSSIFGNIYQKVRSPVTEKKEHDFGPTPPAKDSPVAAEAPQLPEPAAITAPQTTDTLEAAPLETDVVEPIAEQPVAEQPKVESPAAEHKPKKDFFGNLMTMARARSPISGKRDGKNDGAEKTAATATSDVAPPVPAKDDVPAVTTEAETATATAVAPTAPETTETATSPSNNRRRSYFGGFGGKRDKSEGENENKPFDKITSIFRRPSHARHTSSEKDVKKHNAIVATPEEEVEAAVPAAAEATGVEEPKLDEAKVETEKAAGSLGDVVPAAVIMPEHEKPSAVVSATA